MSMHLTHANLHPSNIPAQHQSRWAKRQARATHEIMCQMSSTIMDCQETQLIDQYNVVSRLVTTTSIDRSQTGHGSKPKDPASQADRPIRASNGPRPRGRGRRPGDVEHQAGIGSAQVPCGADAPYDRECSNIIRSFTFTITLYYQPKAKDQHLHRNIESTNRPTLLTCHINPVTTSIQSSTTLAAAAPDPRKPLPAAPHLVLPRPTTCVRVITTIRPGVLSPPPFLPPLHPPLPRHHHHPGGPARTPPPSSPHEPVALRACPPSRTYNRHVVRTLQTHHH